MDRSVVDRVADQQRQRGRMCRVMQRAGLLDVDLAVGFPVAIEDVLAVSDIRAVRRWHGFEWHKTMGCRGPAIGAELDR